MQIFSSIILLIFQLFKPLVSGSNYDMIGPSDMLNQLVDPYVYDKRLRPNFESFNPVRVGVSAHVSSISSIQQADMEFTAVLIIRQFWRDERLRFASPFSEIVLGPDFLQRIWAPDTYFPSEKKSVFHQLMQENTAVYLYSNGSVMISQRYDIVNTRSRTNMTSTKNGICLISVSPHSISLTSDCSMDLQLFPFDSQRCTVTMESYKYNVQHLVYHWRSGISVNPEIRLPRLSVAKCFLTQSFYQYSTGNYSRLSVHFLFTRSVSSFLIEIYLPCILIVVTSWVTFWIDKDASPARVSLGVTTVLAMTTLMTTVSAGLPSVSYVNALDVYMLVCFIMVFGSLLEYAMVNYISTLRASDEYLMDQNDHQRQELETVPRPIRAQPMEPAVKASRVTNIAPLSIDKFSRVFVPATFLVINVLYWSIYYYYKAKQFNGYVQKVKSSQYYEGECQDKDF